MSEHVEAVAETDRCQELMTALANPLQCEREAGHEGSRCYSSWDGLMDVEWN